MSTEIDPDVRAVHDAIREDQGKKQQELETDHWLRALARAHFPTQGFDRGDHKEAAEHLRTVLAKDKLLYDIGEVYRYRSTGLWSAIPNHLLEAIVSDLAGVGVWSPKGTKPLLISRSYTLDATKMFGLLVRASAANRQFAESVTGLGFENGFLTIVDGQPVLRPHSPDNLCRFAYDFAYAPTAPTPMLDAFFDVVFRGEDAENRRTLPMVLQEFVGACLFGEAWKYEKLLILTGAGGNGKSQFLEIARSIFPPGSLAALPPQKWGDKFSVADLAGRLANFVDEIPEREVTSGAVFKAVISGQMISAERKHRDNVTFRPTCGHIFSTNNLFGTTDTSEGFFRRFLIVPFDWKPSQSETKVDIGKTIGRLERRAIVSWAIQGYLRLLAQGGRYTIPSRVQQRTDAWKAEADAARLFLHALYDDHSGVPFFAVQDLYKLYCRWADTTGHLQTSLNKFAKRARDTGILRDAKNSSSRGFSWNHDEVQRLLGVMGDAAPDWGEAPDPPAGSYGSGGFGSSFR